MYDLNKKFILTHPPKCGGTSLEDWFGFLKLREKYPQVNKFKHASLEEHINELKNKNVELGNFFKFSIIRNPWARAVSFYNHYKYQAFEQWMADHGNEELPKYIKDARNMSFKDYIFKYSKRNFNFEVSTKPFMFFQNKFYLDYVIRLEHLTEDLLRIKDKLQLDSEINIPHRNNADVFLNRRHYAEYYDIKTRELIEERFEWDIKTFNYKFT